MTNPGAPAHLSLIEEHTARIVPALPAFELFELAAPCSDEEIEAMLADRRRFTEGEAYPLIGALIGDQPKGEPGQTTSSARRSSSCASAGRGASGPSPHRAPARTNTGLRAPAYSSPADPSLALPR